MKSVLAHTCTLGVLFLLASGCTKTPRVTSTPPASVTLPDEELLVRISRQAIAMRLPDVAFESLDLSTITYHWGIDDLGQDRSEWFTVNYRVTNSKRKTHEYDGTVFKIDMVDVQFKSDGLTYSITKETEKYRSEGEWDLKGWEEWGKPVSNEAFYPVKLTSPLPCPNRHAVAAIALRAIHSFMPAVENSDLVLREVSFHDVKPVEHRAEYVDLTVTFWLRSTIRTTITPREVIVEHDEIRVYMHANGQVDARDVQKLPGKISYNRETIPDPWRPSTSPSAPRTEPAASKTRPVTGPIYYVVGERDDPLLIAKLFGVSLPELEKANHITDTGVKAGQLLKIPFPDNKTAKPTAARDGLPAAHDP